MQTFLKVFQKIDVHAVLVLTNIIIDQLNTKIYDSDNGIPNFRICEKFRDTFSFGTFWTPACLVIYALLQISIYDFEALSNASASFGIDRWSPWVDPTLKVGCTFLWVESIALCWGITEAKQIAYAVKIDAWSALT